MKIYKPLFCLLLFGKLLTIGSFGQTGDQILDGIGETDLMTRYTFKQDAKDWTRNNLHAHLHGSAHSFVADNLFGQVLHLSGSDESYVQIPGEAVVGLESMSISAWVFLTSAHEGQNLFDFGQDRQKHLTHSLNISPYRWNHVTVVWDAAAKIRTIYVNKERVGQKQEDLDLSDVFSLDPKKNNLFIGRSMNGNSKNLQAKLSDFRLYRIALTQEQVVGIHSNSLKKESSTVRVRKERNPDLPHFDKETPQLFNSYLVSVPDIQVETTIGHLPKLPAQIPGIYRDGMEGPKVRVIWPAPKNNEQVLQEGSYVMEGTIPGSPLKPKAQIHIVDTQNPTPARKLETFTLQEVSLDKSPNGSETKFIQNRNKFLSVLAETNPDDFLYMFRNAFGQEQPDGAKALRGWDSQETKLRGHATGHYLSAIAQAYASTGFDSELQDNFKAKMTYMVDVLYELAHLSGRATDRNQEAVSDPLLVPPGPGKAEFDSDLSVEGIRTDYWNWGLGYISAYPPDQFIMLENGARYGGDNAKIWAPYYTLHKILAGLMDIYEISGNEKALEIVRGMGSWVHARLSQVPTETMISMWNRYIAGEYGGMNEAMARLARLTNDAKYLETARLFDNIKVFYGNANHAHGLAKNVDMFRGLHANQHIPQIMGALEEYRVSGLSEYYHIADNFWNRTVHDYMYSIGGVAGARNPSNAECFTVEPATLYENGFSAGGQNETCCTYNMLKLTRNLFLYEQRGELMDYYERGLYNHILASVDEHTPANTYHVPLRAGSRKGFGNPEMHGFTCCNGTALESNTKLQNSIYFHSADNESIYINLFIASTLNWADRDIEIRQSTSFPNEDRTRISVKGKGKFALKIRVPHWATTGFYVTINGKAQDMDVEPGTYVSLMRKWKTGDLVEVHMPFSFRLEPVMDQQNIASLFYGPVLLAAQEPEPRTDWRQIILDAKDIGKSIQGDPEKLEFTIDGVLFKPFFETYGRYSVYYDVRLN